MVQILNISLNPSQSNGRSFYVKNAENETVILRPNNTLKVSKETADNLAAMYPTEIKILEDTANDESLKQKPAKNK